MTATTSKSTLATTKGKLKGQKSGSIIKGKHQMHPEVKVDEPEPIRTKTNVFLYLHLQIIENLPGRDNKMFLRLSHARNKITKLEDHYTDNTDIDLSELSIYNPTFSFTVEQDDIEDLNNCSDCPLQLTLYEQIKNERQDLFEEYRTSVNYDLTTNSQRQLTNVVVVQLDIANDKVTNANTAAAAAVEEATNQEEEEHFVDESYLKPIAQGLIDLVPCFTRKRIFTTQNAFLYPIPDANSIEIPLAVQTVWHMYTLLPLLKELHFCNIAFITFESIYNAPAEIMANHEDLTVDLSFQSKVRNEQNKFDKTKLCSYSIFEKEIIAAQNHNQKWETLKDNTINLNSLGLHSGCKTSMHKLFSDLLHTEGVNFHFDDINVYHDLALVMNSLHRYILTTELAAILEDVIAFNQQEMLVELYHSDHPEDILLQGVIDLSVLLYPRVNACRFAVELRQPIGAGVQKPDKKSGGGGGGRTSKQVRELTTFAIIGICLLVPITESDENMTKLNENFLFRNKLKRCQELEILLDLQPMSHTVEETYKVFDELLGTLIDYIANNNVKSIDDAKAYFCCQMGNIKNTTLKLIAIDFNKRFKTTNSIDFTNLMTTVYKELVGRAYNILQNCNNDDLTECYVSDLQVRAKIINFMNISKYMFESGNKEMSTLMFHKIRSQNKNNTELNFYIFVNDTENQDFDAAKDYLKKTQKEKWMAVDYYTEFIRIYIEYIENLKNETSYNEALENLFISLKNFIYDYPLDTDHWILMYCLYRKYSYTPGMSYTRWKFENLYDKPRKLFPPAPKSRWELYNNYAIKFRTERGIHFFEVVQFFAQLGCYKFSEIVFNEIANECADVERHLMTTTLKILQNNVDTKTMTKSFGSNTEEMRAFVSQVNGHLEHYREAFCDAAMRNYDRILELKIMNYENFELSLFRYGYQMLAQHQYQRALEAFDKCRLAGNGLVANIGMGKSLYGLDRLKEAEKYFAESTKFEVHIPNVWAYLALINLKMGNNFKALEFWKYAKLNPENIISEEILKELRKINYKDVFLYVDKPL